MKWDDNGEGSVAIADILTRMVCVPGCTIDSNVVEFGCATEITCGLASFLAGLWCQTGRCLA